MSKYIRAVRLIFFISIIILFSGCAIVGGIFKAGVGIGVLLTVIIIVAVIYLLGKMRRK